MCSMIWTGCIDAVLDAGPTMRGVESTVLDPIKMMIYRPGAVTAEQIADVAGPVEVFRSTNQLQETPTEALPSPGVGLKHYAPRARLVLVEAREAERNDDLGARLAEAGERRARRAARRDAARRNFGGAEICGGEDLSVGKVGSAGNVGARALCGAARA